MWAADGLAVSNIRTVPTDLTRFRASTSPSYIDVTASSMRVDAANEGVRMGDFDSPR